MPAIQFRLYRQKCDTACVLALLANFAVEPAFAAVDSGCVKWSESNASKARFCRHASSAASGLTLAPGLADDELHESRGRAAPECVRAARSGQLQAAAIHTQRCLLGRCLPPRLRRAQHGRRADRAQVD